MFKKILIANRGEIALRIIRACRELDIQTVAVHSQADRESLHVKLADESVCIGPPECGKSYLSIPNILSAAEITGADAIHPGYGFLAENAEFANVCERCGLGFIGPKSHQISLMGDKIRARAAMKEAGLDMLPSIEVSAGDLSACAGAVEAMGLPVIVKAAAGGGGRGIKIVRDMASLVQTLQMAQAEARASFGDATVFIERYLEHARHIEFQIASDGERVIHFGERDCSIQRRYQKIIEECPSIAVSDETRKAVGARVVRALQEVGYSNLGTVEFLMDRDQNFYFLEMNTRVQVEHPITEEVVGIDLVKLQIQLAAGHRLTMSQGDVEMRGHAIEMRINAEDSERLFPSCGQISALHMPGGPGVRIENGVYDGFTVTPYYDSLLAKLIVWGANRQEAIARARAALRELLVEGVKTNVPLHQRILGDQKFLDGDLSIQYLDNFIKKSNQK